MATSDLAAVFDAIGPDIGPVTPQLWGPVGQSLIFALQLRPGAAVLDVCSGAGASALPAAAAVGPTGRVHAVDLADDLLEQGRLIASDRALQNIDFVCADVTTWEPPSDVPAAGYDALACSFGVFFLPHMDFDVVRLLRLVADGGRVGVSVWRSGALAEFTDAFYEVIGRHRPNTVRRSRHDAARLDTTDKLTAWLDGLGVTSVAVFELSNLIPATDEFAWNLVLGSGFRSAMADMPPAEVEAVRTELLTLLIDRGLHTIDASALIGTGVVRREMTD